MLGVLWTMLMAVLPILELQSQMCEAPIVGQERPVVELSSGKVKGIISNSTDGSLFHGFLSIPYAVPPVGPLRFKPPEPFLRWPDVLDGSSVGPVCPQINLVNGEFIGNEDCLYLNVYIHKQHGSDPKLLPVMLYIHGGGFSYEAAHFNFYGPQNYMNYPVVLVTFNYRLGALGFLSTNDSNAYGNYGMLDQVMAMKWVQKNIKVFGGDPEQVMIFGNSAGAGSAFHHLLSPLSKDLFIKAIAESGTSLNYWALERNPLSKAQRLANVMDCTTDTTEDLIKCLSKKTAKEIVLGTNQLQPTPFLPVNWAPVVEAPGGPGFLTETPMSIIKNNRIVNKVPLIIGHAAFEGYTFYWHHFKSFKYTGSEYFEKQFPEQLFLLTPIQSDMISAIDAIADEYYRDVDLNNATVFTTVFSEIFGDALFNADISEAANLMSEVGVPVYAYIYTYKSQDCLASVFQGPCGIYSSHGDEVYLEFRFLSPAHPMNHNDTAMSKILTSLWVNFASQSELSINNLQKWPLYSKADPHYVDLNLTPTIRSGMLSNKTSFWSETIPNLIHNYTQS